MVDFCADRFKYGDIPSGKHTKRNGKAQCFIMVYNIYICYSYIYICMIICIYIYISDKSANYLCIYI